MHVNLILDEEKRSSSPVSLGLIARLAAMALFVLGAVWVFSFYSSYHALQGEVRYLDEEWTRTESKYKSATQLRNDLAEREATLGEILGWRDARIEWGHQLEAVQAVMPAVIQLSELHVNHSIAAQAGGTSAMVYEMRFSGQTPAERSELNVIQLLEGLKGPAFGRFIESAILPSGSFRQDPTDKNARAFNIVCKYIPRSLP